MCATIYDARIIETFAGKGYTQGSSYLEKLSNRLFTNIELWLKTGVIAPKTTSLLERVFRELGRRLKKIAWGWSDTAVGVRLILRYELGKMTVNEECPELLPAIA